MNRIPQFSSVRAALLASVVLFSAEEVWAQGCVASRCPVNMSPGERLLRSVEGNADHGGEAGIMVTVGYRWLRSDRHFTGTHEEAYRQQEGSEVINDSSYVDVTLAKAITPRFALQLTVPWSEHDRSSVVWDDPDRAKRTRILERFHVQSGGLGDIRAGGTMWVLDPTVHRRGNVLIGLGVDAPTGRKDEKAVHRRLIDNANDIVGDDLRNVDQSIQPGDGGWGIPVDVFAYYSLAKTLSVYASGSYLITPEETNGVITRRSNPFESVMSIADTFAGRVGFDWLVLPKAGLTVSLGMRAEGVPAEDLLGGSDGFRRPGVAVSIEPGISWMKNGWAVQLSVPIAVYRERFKSVADRQWEAASGVPRHGDAAFADYLVLGAVTKSF